MLNIVRSFMMIFIFCIHTGVFSKPFLSFFTRPVGSASGYEGHSGVVASVKRGLEKLNVSFNFNPTNREDIAENVVVLSSTEALQSCIQLKKDKKIKHILAGPNLMVMPFEYDNILADSQIDYVLVPSHEVRRFYQHFNPDIGAIKVWFAGVDVDYWKPCSVDTKNNKVLIYWKTEHESFIAQIESIVKKHKYEPIIIKYGAYTSEAYRSLLSEVDFAIFISRSESQGLALAEAWASNVPTLVWNPQWFIYEQYTSDLVSAAPYLTKATGASWQKLEELDALLLTMDERRNETGPRSWIMENMSDIVSAQHLYDIICMLSNH